MNSKLMNLFMNIIIAQFLIMFNNMFIKYFKYELWNALCLKSLNQIRMYEILKQYEGLGRRELSVQSLRELLGIAPTESD